jgi:hypothetical protein
LCGPRSILNWLTARSLPTPWGRRPAFYTGITRGKKLVVLVGQKKAVAIAVRNVSGRRRWSKLSEWLNPQRSAAGLMTPDVESA